MSAPQVVVDAIMQAMGCNLSPNWNGCRECFEDWTDRGCGHAVKVADAAWDALGLTKQWSTVITLNGNRRRGPETCEPVKSLLPGEVRESRYVTEWQEVTDERS